MRSATREAMTSTRAVLADLGSAVDLGVGAQIFASGRAIARAPQLLNLLADPTADTAGKKVLIDRVFAGQSDATRAVLAAVAGSRWSSQGDLLAGIEDAAVRAVAATADQSTSIEAELFAFETAVRSDAGLELALGTKLGSADQKGSLAERLLAGKVSQQTITIVSNLVQQPRGRRIGEIVRDASRIVADQADKLVATVITATPLSDDQAARVARGIAQRYGRDITVNRVVDPSVIGGVRVQVGGDVIDGTVATRLADLRLQLAG
ncbi:MULTISPECIES: F0F1 ATP synthase subunit delta [unclassified Curtobacterium]|uniref:F0F1 ATP synthase subunit delta n=1 Tax=unclassified Curtobacterium TaxID=257496 RepID=UPI000D8EF847|nr:MULTISPECIES: F0F1 ATP synthase subunit delta [unclassified Curtobacterium]PYY38411.1 F0F1 ATP synthase subunit delta [Curtobacterium sp. MCBD17_030]PZE39632.1 F0F1 ATP synthase subunit delta [Curtobacterium sp. MCPF17_031]